MTTHLIDDLHMRQAHGDAALYYHHYGKTLIGISGMYIDDLLNGGTQSFQDITKKTLSALDSKPRVYDQFDFFGARIRTLKDWSHTMLQQYYARTLKPANTNGSFE